MSTTPSPAASGNPWLDSLTRIWHRFQHIARVSNQVWYWPIFAIGCVTVLWLFTEAKLASAKHEVEMQARQRASAIATAYAEQLDRTLNEIDRLLLLARYIWQREGHVLRLDDYYRAGIFPPLYVNVSIGNTYGDVVTSTLAMPTPLNFSDRDWFVLHKNNRFAGLLIGTQEIGVRTGHVIVRFSRRLETAAGIFTGVVWVTVEPPYLTAFYGDAQLGKDEFISVRRADGPLLATKVGGYREAPRTFYKRDPAFVETSGVVAEAGDHFIDGAARIVAWNKLARFPVLALAGLKEDGMFAAYNEDARTWRRASAMVSFLLLAFGVAGAAYAKLLADRKRQADEVRETYRLAVDAAQEGFYMLRPLTSSTGYPMDFRIEDCNERAANFFDLTRNQVVGQLFSDVVPKSYRDETLRVLRHVMDIGFYEEEFRVPAPTPHSRPAWLYRRFIRSKDGIALVGRDISHAKEQEQTLSQLANTDTLTGLPNRHWLLKYLPEVLKHAAYGMHKVAVMFVDLDDFKNINDSLGHDAGDELLKTVATRLRAAVRTNDHVIRLGGDEFTIILDHVEAVAAVVRVAEQVVKTVHEPFTLKGMPGKHVRASVGISVFPQDGEDGATLLKHADIAMYAAKAAGKGRFHFYQSHLSDRLLLKLNREQMLRAALDQDELVVYYQPRVWTDTNVLCSMEALVRWAHPEHGLIYPGEFIHIAEETGLIIQLGKIVIQKVCADLARWRDAGLPLVPVSINVSAAQFVGHSVRDVLADAVARYNIDPALIEIELTESTMLTSGSAVAHDLAGLREMGIKLLIDDFGTGYSSLSQLRELDVDILKIDRTFTSGLCLDREGEIFFKAIVSLGHALDMAIVAEGVETVEQRTALQALHCDSIQGNLVSVPVPAPEASALLASLTQSTTVATP